MWYGTRRGHTKDLQNPSVIGPRRHRGPAEALFKILEDNDDEEGTLYQQAKQRQQELDAEHPKG
jgi:hypothetical protein